MAGTVTGSATGAGRLSRPKDAARTRSDARDTLTGVSRLEALACLGVLAFTSGEVGEVPARLSDATGSVFEDTGIVFDEVCCRLAMIAMRGTSRHQTFSLVFSPVSLVEPQKPL